LNCIEINYKKLKVKKEIFKGSRSFVLINLTQSKRRKMTPINIEQATLLKFLPHLKNKGLIIDEKRKRTVQTRRSYTLRMERDGTILVKETHCLDCGKRLLRNGHNPRIAILDKDLGKREFRLHRKRCPRCGEIKPDYSSIAPKYGNYHENHKRRTRQHYMNGLMPSQIRDVFKIDFDLDIPLSTIVNWIEKASNPLRKVLKETPVPSSGYWGYDEIHLRINKKRMYALDAVDIMTRFIPAARISESMGRQAGLHFFKEARCHNKLKINAIVKDCTANLGGLFRTRSFKHVMQQNCLTHVKWIVSARVKAFSGLSIRSVKPIPRQWRWLLRRFYNLIDSDTETDAYIQLEILRHTVDQLGGKRIKHLQTAFKQVESYFPKIIAHQRNPFIPTTNNLLESFHKKYTRYPSFKRQMKTIKGAQRILDYRVFKHNFHRFPEYLSEFEGNYETFKIFVSELSKKQSMSGQHRYFQAELRKLSKLFGFYKMVWDDYFLIL
jgi:transposase-like protein